MTVNESKAACIFCRILEGEAPATFLYRDERCAVFMDIRPVNPGHLLIIPIEHAPYLRDVESDTVAHMMRLAQRFAGALRASGMRCEGVNLFLADGEAAMQEVFHCHLHVFPRYRNDGFGLRFGPDYVVRDRGELEAAAAQILAALPEPG
ncbi:MAG TPA: HIT family protein [Vicinamibacterales bacterium]|nr:HIT family protein [Vicinamibacterales bacterium]